MESIEQLAEQAMREAMPTTPDELRQAVIDAKLGVITHKRAQEEFVGPFLSKLAEINMQPVS